MVMAILTIRWKKHSQNLFGQITYFQVIMIKCTIISEIVMVDHKTEWIILLLYMGADFAENSNFKVN